MIKTGLGLSRFVPPSLWKYLRKTRVYLYHRSSSVNIYHCCVHKTGSQWVRAIMGDERTYRYSGLSAYNYQETLPGRQDPRRITERVFTDPFPAGKIVTPIYIDFANFIAFPKPERYKAFFVMRDPCDTLISWYFSSLYSHPLLGDRDKIRRDLNALNTSDGILYSLDHLHHFGLFDAIRSWAVSAQADPNVIVVRFEDITRPGNLAQVKALFTHCDVMMPDAVLAGLLEDHSFKRKSGRKQGEENKKAHYRKGVHGDWKNYFDEKVSSRFAEATGDLIQVTGYDRYQDHQD